MLGLFRLLPGGSAAAAVGEIRGSVLIEEAALLIAEGEKGEKRFKKIPKSFPEIPLSLAVLALCTSEVWPHCAISLFA